MRRVPGSAAARVARPSGSRREAARISTRRERLVAELAGLRRSGEPSNFIDSAQQLLTRWWATANWSAREQLLDAADWLIRLERNRRGHASSAA